MTIGYILPSMTQFPLATLQCCCLVKLMESGYFDEIWLHSVQVFLLVAHLVFLKPAPPGACFEVSLGSDPFSQTLTL